MLLGGILPDIFAISRTRLWPPIYLVTSETGNFKMLNSRRKSKLQWYKNLKISVKLIMGFVLVALIAGVIGAVGIINIKSIARNDTILYENMTVPIAAMSTNAAAFQKVRVLTRDIVVANDPQAIKTYEQEINQLCTVISESAAEFEKRIVLEKVKAEYDHFVEVRKIYVGYLEQLVRLAKENRDSEGTALLQSEKMSRAAHDEQQAIEKLVTLKVTDAKEKADLNTRTANAATLTMGLFIVGGMFLAVVLGIFIAKLISRPIGQLVDAVRKIANGDLDVSVMVDLRDEVGTLAEAFNKMAYNISEVLTTINNAAVQVAAGSKQVSDSSTTLSQGATEQASAIEQLTASIEQISSQTKQNAVNAGQANEIAETAQNEAVQGNTQMQAMLRAMEEINNSSTQISKIIKVIDEIAFQTNILALNAAVEAARAGQHGKGFAVVAEEVRSLAARSANAAKETTGMIEGSIKTVEGGSKIAHETADALNKITEGVSKVASLVGNIAIASNEQATGIAQINQGVMQVSQVVQTNSATAEEGAAASEELSGQAQLLREQVGQFRLKRKSQETSSGYSGSNSDMLNTSENLTGRAYLPAAQPQAVSLAKGEISLNENEFGKY
jgi:methyl-accepting chemotaxis protein